jgi:hypothetical protein
MICQQIEHILSLSLSSEGVSSRNHSFLEKNDQLPLEMLEKAVTYIVDKELFLSFCFISESNFLSFLYNDCFHLYEKDNF